MIQRYKKIPHEERRFDLDLSRRAFLRRNRLTPLQSGQPDREELISRIQRFEIFEHLPAAILQILASSARIGVFRAGEYLWHQDEPNQRVLFIERGLAKTSRLSPVGVNRTYGLYGPGDSMGIYAIWAGMKYPTDAVAMNDGMTAIILDSLALLKCAEKHPSMATPLMTEFSRFTESFIRKIEIVSAGTVSKRVAMLMLMLAERYGKPTGDSGMHLPLNLTLAQIGEIVDARIETVARLLSRWKLQGWLSVGDDGLHFNRMDKVKSLLPTSMTSKPNQSSHN